MRELSTAIWAHTSCPIVTVRTSRGEEGWGLAIEDGLPMGMERQEEDILDGQGVLIMSVEFAMALGLTDMDPVGGTVAGTAEAPGFAEGFAQDGAEAVTTTIESKVPE